MLLPEDREDLAAGKRIPAAGELERISVVLGWFEEIYRGGGNVRESSPLVAAGYEANDAEGLLGLVPDAGADHLEELGVLAQQRLQPFLDQSSPLLLGPSIGPGGLPADVDLIVGRTLIEAKCVRGTVRGGHYEYSLTPALLRQLVGYLLLDDDAQYGCSRVGVSAARYGLLWTIEAEDLIALAGPIEPDLATLQAAFKTVVAR